MPLVLLVLRILSLLLSCATLEARKLKVTHTMKFEFPGEDIVVIADKQPMRCGMCLAKTKYVNIESGYAMAYCDYHVPIEIRALVDKKLPK